MVENEIGEREYTLQSKAINKNARKYTTKRTDCCGTATCGWRRRWGIGAGDNEPCWWLKRANRCLRELAS
jgi:hypothetical protein